MDFIPTPEQQKVIDKCVYWFNNQTGYKRTFEITGPAGSGKTSIVKCIVEKLKLNKSEVAFMTFTGKASLILLADGIPAKTIHSTIYSPEDLPCLDSNGDVIINDETGKPYTEVRFENKRLKDQIRLLVIDESGMVPVSIGEDLLRKRVPIIALGDANQLTPIFGKRFFLANPDCTLQTILRQKKGSPILELASRIYVYKYKRPSDIFRDINPYGENVQFIPINNYNFNELITYDMIICKSNRTRQEMIDLLRYDIYKRTEDFPVVGDRLICRKNEWGNTITDDKIPLFNGMTGIVENVDFSSITPNKVAIDFKPDLINASFMNLTIDRKYINTPCYKDRLINSWKSSYSLFQYSYAITCHLAQGSQYNSVCIIFPNYKFNDDDRRWLYTAVTRAVNNVIILYY